MITEIFLPKFISARIVLSIVLIGYSSAGLCQDFAAVFQNTVIQPKKIIRKGEGHYFIDFGKDAFGKLIVQLKSQERDSIVIHLGERLSSSLTVDKKPGGTIRYQRIVVRHVPVNKVYEIALKADQRNTGPAAVPLPDSFGVIMPFRYVEIENLGVPIKDVNFTQKIYHYRFNDDASCFHSSDTVLNRVWELCKHTIKATSFCGLYVDGDRERIPYEADALINQLSHYAADGEYTLARQTNEYFITHPTWPTEWILHTVPLFYYDYLYTGNTDAVRKHYEALKHKTLMALENNDGLISTTSSLLTDTLMRNIGFRNRTTKISDIVDWPEIERDGYEMRSVNTVVNAFYFLNLKLMAALAGAIGEKEDSVFFSSKSVHVRRAINQNLFDNRQRIYVDGEGSSHSSLHANVFPLAFGIVADENLKSVISFVKGRGMACSVYSAQYLLEGLYQHGEADYALSLMNSTEGKRNWWNMIRAGATMTPEAWDITYKPNLDWNHAWGTAPINIIARYTWGITPASPGFRKVQISPQLSSVAHSKIRVPTIRGAIDASYKKIGKHRKKFLINLPALVAGEFVLTGTYSKVRVNRKLVQPVNRSVTLDPGKNKIKIVSAKR
jgi:alpha-L-rhamnosidase